MKTQAFLKMVTVFTFSTIAISTAAYAGEGGNGSGGGNIKKPTKVEASEIGAFLASSNAERVLFRWANGLEIKQAAGTLRSALLDRLVSAEPKPTTRIQNLIVLVRHQSACRNDRDHVEDASAYTGVDNEICLSLERIARKVTSVDYRARVLSLIIHEVTHLALGLDAETEASNTEAIAFNDFMKLDWNEQIDESAYGFTTAADRLKTASVLLDPSATLPNEIYSPIQSTQRACMALMDGLSALDQELAMKAPESIKRAVFFQGGLMYAIVRDKFEQTALRFYTAAQVPEFRAWHQAYYNLTVGACGQAIGPERTAFLNRLNSLSVQIGKSAQRTDFLKPLEIKDIN